MSDQRPWDVAYPPRPDQQRLPGQRPPGDHREVAGPVPALALAMACVPLGLTNVVGIAVGVVAMATRPRGAAGRGMGLAAVVVGSLWLVVGVGVGVGLLVASGSGDADRVVALQERIDELESEAERAGGLDDDLDDWDYYTLDDLDDADERAGVTLLAEEVPIVDLELGDCVLDPELNYLIWWGDPFHEVAAVVDCADPHDAEYLGSVDLPSAEFPAGEPADEELLWEEASTLCDDLFYLVAGERSYLANTSTYAAFVPPPDVAWEAGDREVACFASSEELTTGSVRGVEQG
ncbi:septum formation family protein [Nocardioides zeae]|uniref:Septum formation family protein n=1 Tax=Nocardioides imazamoxiresistens TaxID=3231893 RepID=A0ABU3PRU3_9ACTN|nr:septum formation family protein [Nocardioides zeae]MDT9591913.1 septum formation family protein [Nocardioides zeae]